MTLRIEDMIRHQGAAQQAADRAMRVYYENLGNRSLRELADLLESADRNDWEDDGTEGLGGFRPHLRSVESVLASRKVRR